MAAVLLAEEKSESSADDDDDDDNDDGAMGSESDHVSQSMGSSAPRFSARLASANSSRLVTMSMSAASEPGRRCTACMALMSSSYSTSM